MRLIENQEARWLDEPLCRRARTSGGSIALGRERVLVDFNS